MVALYPGLLRGKNLGMRVAHWNDVHISFLYGAAGISS